MRSEKKVMRSVAVLVYRMIGPFVDPIRFFRAFRDYAGYMRGLIRYKKMVRNKKDAPAILDLHPVLGQNTGETGIDAAYFYQGVWAFEKILQSGVKRHVDIASQTDLVAYLSQIVHTVFVDIRPLLVELRNFESVKGSVTQLPFPDDSVESVSCLHVVEHVGLGRYGDALDPTGTEKAFRELKRVLAKKGNLYLSLPIGQQRVCFNAHRVLSPLTVLDAFSDLRLIEFRYIDDAGKYHQEARPEDCLTAVYSTGFFHFRKEE